MHEIILVDDASSAAHLGGQLEDYVVRLPVQVSIIRLAERSGLIRARLQGAAAATAPVLTFLDSHVECGTVGILSKEVRIIKLPPSGALRMLNHQHI